MRSYTKSKISPCPVPNHIQNLIHNQDQNNSKNSPKPSENQFKTSPKPGQCQVKEQKDLIPVESVYLPDSTLLPDAFAQNWMYPVISVFE